jgi:hypothetical protein
MASCAELSGAVARGDVSGDQASEIAKAEASSPGAATHLLVVAQKESFHVLKHTARRVRLDAEQHKDLAARQRAARAAASHSDELGMVHVHVAWEPHIGAPIGARAEGEAARRARAARRAGGAAGKGVEEGEVCKIPGIGPVAPQVARDIAADAFLTGVFYDGTDLRHMRRWSRSIPVEVAVALELGDPPHFDGIACVDCGNRFAIEFDHVRPRAGRGPTSKDNLKPRCYRCHQEKTARDRAAGWLKGAAPPGGRAGEEEMVKGLGPSP